MIGQIVTGWIRTIVPIVLGPVLAWATIKLGVEFDGEATFAVVSALLSGAYYTLARLLEQRWPAAGALLGRASQPTYSSKSSVGV